jgi:uncharacterized membrane protein
MSTTAKCDVILNFEGEWIWEFFSIRIASTKEEAEAKVLAENLVAKFTPIIKDGVTIVGSVEPSRFKEEV